MRLLLAILSIVGTFLLVESRTFPLLGGYQAQTQINDNVIELAKWAAINLPQYTKVNGEYSVLTIRDLRTQVVSGINYKFTIDVLLGTPENKYFFHTCDVAIYDQPWTKMRYFFEVPDCKINRDYPVK